MRLANVLRHALAALALAAVLAGAAPLPAQVVLNEILGDPATDWNGDGEVDWKLDEWIEVRNAGTAAVDLSAYYLRDILGEDPHLNLSGTLAPGETAVFYGSDAVAWQQANGYGSSGLSLNNGGDGVYLVARDPDEPEAWIVLDERVYDDHVAEDDRSCGWLPDGMTWVLFDALNPYDDETPPTGTGCEPTPGVPNDCEPETPVASRSWGAVKAAYDR